MTDGQPSRSDRPTPFSLNRRSLLKAGGASTVIGIGAFGFKRDPSQVGESAIHHVGPNSEFQTIQSAYNAFDHTGGRILVAHDYNAQNESFPIELSQTDKEGNGIPFILEGEDVSETSIDATGSGENVLQVIGPGVDYRRRVLIRNLRIRGGNSGIVLRRCPYSHMENVVVHQCQEHGIHLAEADVGNFGFSLRNVTAWNCGYNGFRLEEEAHPNAVTFADCQAILCGHKDSQYSGVSLRNSSIRWVGGVIQENYGYGIDLRNSNAPYLGGVYFEGNGLHLKTPVDIYLGATHTDTDSEGVGVHAPMIESCYFNGRFYYHDHRDGLTAATRGINIQKAFGGGVRACAYQNYTEAFLAVFGDTKGSNSDIVDFDLNRSTHWDIKESTDPTAFISVTNGHRLRDSGTVISQDLKQHEIKGAYDGDQAIHDSGHAPKLAIWSADENAWYLSDGSKI